MASSSNSQSHDIFLCFRGSDTRKKFTDHLYKALKQEEFETFRDEEDIERGEDIKSELRKAIWNSKLSIIVLSKNFANSTMCLFEIQTILEHRKKSDHLILPVFYEVEPREIKEQARDLDFAEKEVTIEEVKGWSAALKEVANMAGMVSQNQSGGYETKFIEEIIGELKSKLNGERPRVADRLIGHQTIRYVERVKDSVTNPPTQEFNFLPLSTLSQLSSPPPQKDIVGIVVGVSHKEKRKRKRDSMDFSIREIMLTDATMNEELTPVRSITDKTNDWKAKVTIAEKLYERSCKTSPSKYQKLVLIDAEGTQVHGIIWGNNIEKLRDRVKVRHKYYISNAQVEFVVPKFRICKSQWQWVLNASTLIQPAENNDENIHISGYNCMPFSQFGNHLNSEVLIDILAAVVEVRPLKVVQFSGKSLDAREIVVIDQESKPAVLTLWNQFAFNEGAEFEARIGSFPIIIGVRLRVTSYNGLSLATQADSTFIINPKCFATDVLRSWCIENEETIKSLLLQLQAQSSKRIVAHPPEKDIIGIIDVPTSLEQLKQNSYWVKAQISIVSLDQSFWYMACSSCNKTINAKFQTVFHCLHCDEKDVVAQPRARFQVELKDNTGSMTATMFEDTAEILFSVDGVKLMKYTSEDAKVSSEAFQALNIDEYQTLKLIPQQYQPRGTTLLQFKIGPLPNDDIHAVADTSSLHAKPTQPTAKKQFFSSQDSE